MKTPEVFSYLAQFWRGLGDDADAAGLGTVGVEEDPAGCPCPCDNQNLSILEIAWLLISLAYLGVFFITIVVLGPILWKRIQAIYGKDDDRRYASMTSDSNRRAFLMSRSRRVRPKRKGKYR